MERALVTSLTKRGIKQLRTVRLEFIPSAIYAYTVGYNRFKAFSSQFVEEAAAQVADVTLRANEKDGHL